MKVKLWGVNLSDQERKRLAKFIRSNLQDPNTEIEFVIPTAEDIAKADTKSKRGGVDGG